MSEREKLFVRLVVRINAWRHDYMLGTEANNVADTLLSDVLDYLARDQSQGAQPARRQVIEECWKELRRVAQFQAAEYIKAMYDAAPAESQGAQPVAWICDADLRQLREHGLATVYAFKQSFALMPHEEQTPLYAAQPAPDAPPKENSNVDMGVGSETGIRSALSGDAVGVVGVTPDAPPQVSTSTVIAGRDPVAWTDGINPTHHPQTPSTADDGLIAKLDRVLVMIAKDDGADDSILIDGFSGGGELLELTVGDLRDLRAALSRQPSADAEDAARIDFIARELCKPHGYELYPVGADVEYKEDGNTIDHVRSWTWFGHTAPTFRECIDLARSKESP